MTTTVTLQASIAATGGNPIAVHDQFEVLFDQLIDDSHRQGVREILWDTMMLGTDEFSYDDSSYAGSSIVMYRMWTASVLAILDEE